MLLFGNRLREMRKKLNLTQEDLGKMIGVTKVSICCYEKGSRIPSIETVIDISNHLNVKASYLLGLDTYMVAEDNVNYGINLNKEEIILIKELRKNPSLYLKLLNDPKRIIELIDKKIR